MENRRADSDGRSFAADPRGEAGAPASPELFFRGIAASPGIALGRVHLVASEDPDVEDFDLAPEQLDEELRRFHRAIERTREDLRVLRQSLAAEMGETHAKIFDAHLAVLDDPVLFPATEAAVRAERRSVSAVFHRLVNEEAAKFAQSDIEYLRERLADILDVERRVLRHLAGAADGDLLASLPDGDVILVARDIAPSDAAALVRAPVCGVATDAGGRTAHTALLAQERGIPAVVALRGALRHAYEGQFAIVDGSRGEVLLDPSPAQIKYYTKKQAQFASFQRSLEQRREEPAVTRDGHGLGLSGNVSAPAEVQQVLERGGEGVGLYRTEYLFLGRSTLPTEEEQVAAYETVARHLAPRPVIIRTLDVGGDKGVGHLEHTRQKNPVLGVRGIRLCQEQEPLFRTQIRAILRASRYRNVKVMFPLITRVEEVRWARGILREEARALVEAGHEIDLGLEVGVMIETPAAMLIAAQLASISDFFSIGSNDLTQYTLAVDRVNEHVAHLFDPLHPAVLRGIRLTVEAARRRGIWVGVCGDMAADPVALALLVGIGVDEISTSPAAIPQVKALIRALSYAESEDLAGRALECDTAEDIRQFVTARLADIFPEMFA